LIDVEYYFDNEPESGSQAEKDFDKLFVAIEDYEAVHYPIEPSN
jgi:antitoxin component HigA of HigAB toxin-antitoxin module